MLQHGATSDNFPTQRAIFLVLIEVDANLEITAISDLNMTLWVSNFMEICFQEIHEVTGNFRDKRNDTFCVSVLFLYNRIRHVLFTHPNDFLPLPVIFLQAALGLSGMGISINQCSFFPVFLNDFPIPTLLRADML